MRPGGLVNLFGGCAPGTSIPLDTHLVHYSELTLKGVYHHRPDTFRRAIALLADPEFKADLLISGVRPIAEVVDALRSMIRKEALKIVIRNGAAADAEAVATIGRHTDLSALQRVLDSIGPHTDLWRAARGRASWTPHRARRCRRAAPSC